MSSGANSPALSTADVGSLLESSGATSGVGAGLAPESPAGRLARSVGRLLRWWLDLAKEGVVRRLEQAIELADQRRRQRRYRARTGTPDPWRPLAGGDSSTLPTSERRAAGGGKSSFSTAAWSAAASRPFAPVQVHGRGPPAA